MIQQVTGLRSYGCPTPVLFSNGVALMTALIFPLQLSGPASTIFASPVPTQQCQVSDGGIDVVIEVLDGNGNPVVVHGATAMSILVSRPSGATVLVPAHFFTNGFDGQIAFSTGSTTPFGAGLNEFGSWRVQGRIILDGDLLYTSIGSFTVNPNLGA